MTKKVCGTCFYFSCDYLDTICGNWRRPKIYSVTHNKPACTAWRANKWMPTYPSTESERAKLSARGSR